MSLSLTSARLEILGLHVAVPPLPGATRTFETAVDLLSATAWAISRPPLPMTMTVAMMMICEDRASVGYASLSQKVRSPAPATHTHKLTQHTFSTHTALREKTSSFVFTHTQKKLQESSERGREAAAA